MKLCLLTGPFPPIHSGIGDYTYFLGRSLAEQGHQVDVVTLSGEGDSPLLYPLARNVTVHRIVAGWGLGGTTAVVRHLRASRPEALVFQYAPHAFHRRGLTFAINLLPWIVRVTTRVRVVTNFHELYIPFDRSPKRVLAALWQRAAAVLMASGSHVLSVTAVDWKRRLKGLGIRKGVQVIPVGSNIPQTVRSQEESSRLRKQFLRSSDGLLIAGYGARHDRDIPAALAALRQLKNHQPAKLLWIGGGKPSEQYQLRIDQAIQANGLGQDDVEWTEVLPHPLVSELLAACDLMLLPFIDGISTRRTSAVTALQHALPLLTTRGSQLEPWFVHGKNVYLVPLGDKQALADGLVDLARRPELRAQLAEGARALYDTHFAWDVIAERVSCLAQGGTGL